MLHKFSKILKKQHKSKLLTNYDTTDNAGNKNIIFRKLINWLILRN